MLRQCIVVLLCFFSLRALSESPSALDERVWALEADLAAMKERLAKTTDLAMQVRPSAFNPSITVVGELLAKYGFGLAKDHKKDHDHDHDHDHAKHAAEKFKNGVALGEIELEFSAEIDPFASALVALALHPHAFDHVDLHVEEAYLQFHKWPGLGFAPLGMRLKLGRFKTAIGRMNRLHRHHIAQVNYPRAMRAFLGEEGFASQGLSLNMGFNPAESTAIELFLEGVVSSALEIQEDGAEKTPSGIAHLWLHHGLSQTQFLDVGLSSLVGRKKKSKAEALWLISNDLHYSYLPHGHGQNPMFLLGNEFFMANAVESGRWPLGNFTWAQLKLLGSSFLGLSYDLAPKKAELQSFEHALGATLSYYTSEFLRFRFAYEHVMPSISSFKGDHRFFGSLMFILGSHPLDPYFVNR